MNNLLRLNYLTINKIDEGPKGIRALVIIGLMLGLMALAASGVIFRTLGIIFAVIICIQIILWAFNIGSKPYDNSKNT